MRQFHKLSSKITLITLIIEAALLSFIYSSPAWADPFSLSGPETRKTGWEFDVGARVGWTDYREKASNVKAKWDSMYLRWDAAVDNMQDEMPGTKFRAALSYFFTPIDQEIWSVNHIEYQTNDMDYWGIVPSLEIGHKFLTIGEGHQWSLTPFLGYEYRRIRFKRANFRVSNVIASRETVSETYDIHALNLGSYAAYKFDNRWGLFSKLSCGFILDNRADNSALGTIDGGGGFLLKTDIGFDYWLDEIRTLSIGAFTEWEYLKGGSSGNVIWPDNYLSAYGLLVSYKMYWDAAKTFKKAKKKEVEVAFVRDLPEYTVMPVPKPVPTAAPPPMKSAPAPVAAKPSFVPAQESYDPAEYYSAVRERVAAAISGIDTTEKGEAQIMLSITADGRLKTVNIVDEKSNASPGLKTSIIQAVSGVSPFQKFPAGLKKEKVLLTIPVILS